MKINDIIIRFTTVNENKLNECCCINVYDKSIFKKYRGNFEVMDIHNYEYTIWFKCVEVNYQLTYNRYIDEAGVILEFNILFEDLPSKVQEIYKLISLN